MKSFIRESILLSSALGSALVSAQFAGSPSASVSSVASSTSSGPTHTWTITVGKADHKMVPDVTLANVGDMIEFQFFPTNHSIVRAEYGYPCIPYEKTGVGKVGFFAGFHPVDAILADPPKWSIRINDTDPIFFYCSAPGSCIKYAMLGVINPNATTSLVKQKEEAKNSAYMLQPGEDFPEEGDPTSSDSSSTASATTHAASTRYESPTPTSTTAAASTPTASPEPEKKSGLSPGAIAGIAIGAAVVAVMAGALFYLLGRHKSLNRAIRAGSQPPPPPGPEMRTPTISGYPHPPGPEVPPYTFIASSRRDSNSHYYDDPAYPKTFAHQSVGEVYPPVPGNDMANNLPPRWSNLDAYSRHSSPPPPGSPYSNVGSIEQTRLAQNASPGVTEQLLDEQQPRPTRAQGPHELAAQIRGASPTEGQGLAQDIKYR